LPVCQKKGAILTMVERVFAMIINELGFIDDRLYMHPAFLANKPVNRLFRADIEAHHVNDNA